MLDHVSRLVRFACRTLLIASLSVVIAHAAPPKLVLQITVDQLRGDLLPRFKDRFGEGGFRLLMERGVYFANANYRTANTVTCAGHAVLVTGADVGEHGIVAND
ncbi:MAG TPA: alkaline phosphatase family protein, partial [Candidatus Acidoferrum sp.]|nr:alkaline phosphatase family protein [Candidatus Acidoferrum sp.]